MTTAGFLAVWIGLFAVGIALVYATGRRFERRWPVLSLVYLILLASAVLIASWMAAERIAGIEYASCEEMDPSAERLNGFSPSEFRARCIATQDNSEWLARRRRPG